MVIFLFIVFITIIFIFSSKKLSPIPYFPSQKIDLPKIIKALNLKNNQTVFDLGAGDGIVIFEAAKWTYKHKLNTQFIAVEINPVLILIMNIRRIFHINKNNIKIIYGDIFELDFKNFINFTYGSVVTDPYNITFYLYISPWYLEKVIENCLHSEALAKGCKLKIENFHVVSYMYPIKS
ncbi:MAG: class I SAM-dependent methyltransferase, partial [Candidatus Roizmanbacteria bacterium]|nr:class I SAM-dependent methyltransferase [Candidatus Roizmanbacteria bacterium]